MITGERRDGKLSRGVREEDDETGPEPRAPRRRPTSLGGRAGETDRRRRRHRAPARPYLANKALDVVRRGYWNELRDRAGRDDARRFKHARWALLKRPEHLTDTQHDQLAAIRRAGGQVWRSYRLKEALRAIFDRDLTPAEAAVLLDRWIAWAQRSRLESFVKLQRTIRKHRAGILAALELGINNGRSEGLNRKVRSITSRAFGFHSADALAAMIMLCCGPIQLRLPHDNRSNQ
jgi:transposase